MSAADITRALLADFDSMKGGSVFDATQVDSLDNETSERNAFRKRLLKAFEGTYKRPLEHYLGCEIARDHIAGTTTFCQKH